MCSLMRVNLQPAFILHGRPYRDTSLLVDVLSQEYGRINGVLRGVRSKSSRFKGIARPFTPLVMSWSGKGKLVTIHSLEPSGESYWLTGKALVSAFYLNELLIRFLHPYDPQADIYAIYARALAGLHAANANNLEPILRTFEFDLLKLLGFGLQLSKTRDTRETVLPDKFYVVIPDSGIEPLVAATPNENCWLGRRLVAIEARDFSSIEVQRDAKRLIRLLLQPMLGGRPLKSRACFSGVAARPNSNSTSLG